MSGVVGEDGADGVDITVLRTCGEEEANGEVERS